MGEKNQVALGFMSDDHRRVHDFAVVELPRIGEPLPPARVGAIRDELEQHMTFVFRNAAGAVTWAYPVTVDPTPHRVTFSTGERINAA
jgi:hypothetical protein